MSVVPSAHRRSLSEVLAGRISHELGASDEIVVHVARGMNVICTVEVRQASGYLEVVDAGLAGPQQRVRT